MKKLFICIFVLLLLLSLVGCGDANNPNPSGNTNPRNSQQDGKNGVDKNALHLRHDVYAKARADFGNYICDVSDDHPVVAIKQNLVLEASTVNIDYLLPLKYFGYSFTDSGQFNREFESAMLKGMYGNSFEYSYENGTYTLNNAKSGDDILNMTARYDGDADSLSYEVYRNGQFVFFFEYSKIDGGYASQSYFRTIVEQNFGGEPVTAFCNYRVIFRDNNGSCSRFDKLDSKPVSIFRKIPDMETFIEGATHWFTINDGKFTGNLSGSEF